jgi:hypothetical protein
LLILWRSISIQNSMVPRWLMQVLHPPQKFERPPFCNGWRYGVKRYGIEVTFNGMTSLLNFINIYHLVQKLLEEDTQTDGRTDRQTGDLISLTFLFEESRLRNEVYVNHTKFYWHWSSHLGPVMWGRTDTTKLLGAFGSFSVMHLKITKLNCVYRTFQNRNTWKGTENTAISISILCILLWLLASYTDDRSSVLHSIYFRHNIYLYL